MKILTLIKEIAIYIANHIMIYLIYQFYKRVIKLELKQLLICNFHLIFKHSKDDIELLFADKNNVKILSDKCDKNKTFMNNFQTACEIMVIIEKRIIPLYKKYLMKNLHKSFKNSNSSTNFLNTIISNVCTYKNKNDVDKYIVSKLKKTNLNNKWPKKLNEEVKLAIIESLIHFYKIESIEPKAVTIGYKDLAEDADLNSILSLFLLELNYRPMYIVLKYIEKLNKETRIGAKLSSGLVNKIKNVYGIETSVKDLPDYKIVDALVKTLE